MSRKRTSKIIKKPLTLSTAPVPSVKDHILDRTIYLIGKKHTTDVTVREIAKEAGVNVAAINYYFSSKEQMFSQLADRFLAGFDEVMGILETPKIPVEERLRQWSELVMRHLTDYPGFLPVMEQHMTTGPHDLFGRALGVAMQRAAILLSSVLRELVGSENEDRITFKLTLLISALAGPFPGLVGRVQQRSGIRDPSDRTQFLDMLIEHLRQ